MQGVGLTVYFCSSGEKIGVSEYYIIAVQKVINLLVAPE